MPVHGVFIDKVVAVYRYLRPTGKAWVLLLEQALAPGRAHSDFPEITVGDGNPEISLTTVENVCTLSLP